MLLKNKNENLRSVIKSDKILLSKEECYCYAHDASNLVKIKNTPEMVVFVESTDDVIKVMEYAYANEIPVISRGAGTNTVGACTCPKGGIVLNFSKMNKILEINSADMTAKVQPGVIVGDLKNEAEKLGLFFPPDPSNYKVSTIGGAIAQSSGGAMSFKYGTTKDYVLSLKVVTSDGRLMTLGSETIKDASGYHLAQLMVGSEGTLAVIVEATLKLIPAPEEIYSISAYFDNISDTVTSVDKIINSRIFPSAIDFMDKNSIITVDDFAKCGLDKTKACMLLISIDGSSLSAKNDAEKMSEILLSSGASGIEISENDSVWKARRVSYAAASRLAPDIITDDIIVPREKIAIMINKCFEIAKKYNLKMCLVGHIGDGNLHPQIALNLENDEEFKNYNNAKAEMYETVYNLGGTISAEHGIGETKKQYLRKFADSSAIEYMKLIKQVFDPKNILNPDKIY